MVRSRAGSGQACASPPKSPRHCRGRDQLESPSLERSGPPAHSVGSALRLAARLSSAQLDEPRRARRRGGVVDEEALIDAVDSGHVACAALDVYATEPLPKDSPLRNHPGIITTPHLGASTREAQIAVGTQSTRQIRDFLLNGTVANTVCV